MCILENEKNVKPVPVFRTGTGFHKNGEPVTGPITNSGSGSGPVPVPAVLMLIPTPSYYQIVLLQTVFTSNCFID